MLESILSAAISKPAVEYPNSGPGPKMLLKGNTNIGFFGEVPAGEMPTYLQVYQNLGAISFITYNANITNTWLKYFYKNKIVYISKEWTASNVGWVYLYRAGGVYGVDGKGAYPWPGDNVNQRRPITVNTADDSKSWIVVPRLLSGAPADPYGAGSTPVGNSELDDLLLASCNSGTPQANTLATYQSSVLQLNQVHSILESTLATPSDNSLVRGYGGSISQGFQSINKADRSGYNQVIRTVLALDNNPLA